MAITKRIMIRCCLPNGHQHPKVIEALEQALIVGYDGFTRCPMLGAWKDDTGAIQREAGSVYEISFENTWLCKLAADLFRQAARAMGETWVHIERHEFDAMHTKVN